jgi:hypothetical protein
MNAPAQALLSLDLEDWAFARIRSLTEETERDACRAFFQRIRESLLPRLQRATGVDLHFIIEELGRMRAALEAQSDLGSACRSTLLERFIKALSPFAVCPPPAETQSAEPEAVVETPYVPLAAEWDALQRELGEDIDAAKILQQLRCLQDEISRMRTDAEELERLKEALRQDFGTDDPARLATRPAAPASETTLRTQLGETKKELSAARIKLRDLEIEFDTTDSIVVRQRLRRMRDELYSKERVQARILTERTILAAEFHGLDASGIVEQTRGLKATLAELQTTNQALNQQLKQLRIDLEDIDIGSLLGEVETALHTLTHT